MIGIIYYIILATLLLLAVYQLIEVERTINQQMERLSRLWKRFDKEVTELKEQKEREVQNGRDN